MKHKVGTIDQLTQESQEILNEYVGDSFTTELETLFHPAVVLTELTKDLKLGIEHGEIDWVQLNQEIETLIDQGFTYLVVPPPFE